MRNKFKFYFILLIGIIFFNQLALGAAPAANTDIGNQAVLKFVTAAGQNEELSSNIVITRVQQVYSISIAPNRTATILAGQETVFAHTVTNNGNGIDSIDLTHNYPNTYTVEIFVDTNNNGVIDADENTALTSLDNINPATSTGILVKVTTPISETGTVTMTLTSTSQGDNTQTNWVTETINYTVNAAVTVQKSFDVTSASGEFEQIITVKFKLANSSPTASGRFELYDTLVSGFSYVPNSAKWVGFGETTEVALTDAAGTTEGGIAWFAKSGQFINFETITVPGNTSFSDVGGYLEVQIKVAAEASVGTLTNMATFDYNDGVTLITGQESNTVTYDILKYVKAEYTGETLTVGNQGETLIFKNTLTNQGNDSEIFNLTVDGGNSTFPAGSVSTATLLFKTSNGDYIAPTDNNGDNIIDTGNLGAGDSLDVYLQITLTDDIADGSYSIDKIATSTHTPAYLVTATDTVSSVVAPTVDLTNDQSAWVANSNPKTIDTSTPGVGQGPETNPVVTKTVTPDVEKTVDYTLYINNLNKFVSDTFDLSVSPDSGFSTTTLPHGITVEFIDVNGSLTNTGVLAPETDKVVTARVTVPQAAPAGPVALYFRAKSPTSGIQDIKYDLLTIAPFRKVTIAPETATATSVPNGTVVFTHTVTNEGNVNEGGGIGNGSSSLTLPITDSLPGFLSAIYIDSNQNGQYDSGTDQLYNFESFGGLEPGEYSTIFLVTTTPVDAAKDAQNNTAIVVTASDDSYGVTAITNASDDAITIIRDELSIEKFQSLDGITYTKDMQMSEPGKPIYYMVEITNTGTAPAQNAIIENDVPPYTTLANVDSDTNPGTKSFPSYIRILADGTYGTYSPATEYPTMGETGLIRVESGALGVNEKVRLYFHVKIDE